MSTKNNKTGVSVEKEQKTRLTMLEQKEFIGDMKTNITSTLEVANLISSFFGPVFSDYCGCEICFNDGHGLPIISASMPYGALYVDLYFKDGGKAINGIKNITRIGQDEDTGKLDLGARVARINGTRKGNVYNVTKDTYEALEEFVSGNNLRAIRWNERTQEIISPMSVYGKEEVTVCISGLDLNKIITKIYGDKSKEGRYEYVAAPSTVIPNQNSVRRDFIISITQLNVEAVRTLERTLGVYSGNSPQYYTYNR